LTFPYETGKLANLEQEMIRLKIDILGVSETWWPGTGEFHSGKVKVFYSGNNTTNHRNGVAIIIAEKHKNCVKEFVPLSDRAMLLKLDAKPIAINIIQVYAPTADKNEDDIDKFYGEVLELLKYTKPHEINMIMGDFNAKVGVGKVENVVGAFALGNRNERGDRLIQFCQEENLTITNTWFDLPPRKLYTWKSPQDTPQNIVRNQIDYILINRRFKTSISRVSTYPGADVPSDHNLLLSKLKIKLSNNKVRKQLQHLDLDKLKNEETKMQLANELNENLRNMNSDQDINDQWNHLKNSVSSISKRVIGVAKYKVRKRWMTEEILQLMDKRREHRGKNSSEYRQIHRVIRSKIRQAKAAWLTRECEELENLNRVHDARALHKKVKEISGANRKITNATLANDQNQNETDPKEKRKIWEKYIENLFADDSRPAECIVVPTPQNPLSGPPITRDEIQKAVKSSKSGKAVGPDEIPAEIIKLLDENSLSQLEKIFNKIYDSGEYPKDFLKSNFIALPKKPRARQCKDHRLISIMSHALKIFLKIIHSRIYKKCEENMGREQFGFKDGLGTREALFCTQVLVQNCQDVKKDVFLCFIDYEKAFDRVQHEKLVEIMNNMGFDQKDTRCITNLYWNQTAVVQMKEGNTKEVKICRGVRQ